jgi:hypothetical protein
MSKIFIDPCCDREQCFEKKLSMDTFCCEFTEAIVEGALRQTLFETVGTSNVTACFKIENVCEQTILVLVATKGRPDPAIADAIRVEPGSCFTGTVNCLKRIQVQCSGTALGQICKGKLELKLFYDVH